MEIKKTIKFNKIEDIYNFVRTINNVIDCDIDIASKKNPRHRVDAKSVMGIFALDLSCELDVILCKCNTDEDVDKFFSIVQPYIIEGESIDGEY